MTFQDYVNQRKKKREKAQQVSQKTTQQGGSPFTFQDYMNQRRQEQQQEDADKRTKVANWLKSYQQLVENGVGYHSMADIDLLLSGYDEIKGYANRLGLSEAKGMSDYLKAQKDIINSFDNENDYNFWYDRRDTKARRELYQKQTAREQAIVRTITELQKQGAGDDKIKSLQDELAQIRTEKRNYERGNYNASGLGYGFKAADDYVEYMDEADFDQVAANREFGDPSAEEYYGYYKNANAKAGDTWYNPETGKVEAVPVGMREQDPGKAPVIHDKLGFYKTINGDATATYSGQVGEDYTEIMQDAEVQGWDYLTEDEEKVYYYLLNSQGEEAAAKYLKDMSLLLTQRRAFQEEMQWEEDYANANAWDKFWKNAWSHVENVFGGGISVIDDMVRQGRGEDVNPYSNAHYMRRHGQHTRGAIAQELETLIPGEIPLIDYSVGDAYNAVMSAGDSALSYAIGSTPYALLMGGGAASDEAHRLFKQGANSDQIFWGGLGAGAAETIGERISVGSLKGIKNMSGGFLKKAAVQGAVEASEEAFTEGLNTASNAYVMGRQSDWQKLLDEKNGDVGAALGQKALDAAKAGVSGFISGFVGAGAASAGPSISRQSQTRQEGRQILAADSVGSLQQISADLSKNDYVPKSLQKQLSQQAAEVAKKPSNKNVGKLSDTVSQAQNAVSKAEAAAKLQELGYSKSKANTIADAMVKQATDQYLSSSEQRLLDGLADNAKLQEVYDTVSQSNAVDKFQKMVSSNLDKKVEDTKLAQGYEQKVIDHVVAAEIKAKQAAGETVNRAQIEKKVRRDMENGNISTETIEEVLGDDAYREYKEALEQETAAYEELKGLYKGEENTEALERFLKQSKLPELRRKLSQSVIGKVNGSYLAESYNQKAQKGKRFTADLSRYTEAERAIVQKAIDSGVLNNTRATHEFVDLVAKLAAARGITFDFTTNQKLRQTGLALEGKTVNGYVDANGNITVNMNSPKYLNTVVGHEVAHVLENTDLYEDFQKFAVEFGKSRKASDSKFENEYQERLRNAIDLYQNVEGYEGAQGLEKIKKEVVADLVGDYLFTDSVFLERLGEKPGLARRIYNKIKQMYRMATAGSKEARQLEQLKNKFEKMFQAKSDSKADTKAQKNTTKEGGVRYSLNDGTTKNATDLSRTDLRYLLEQAQYGVLSDGSYIPLRRNTPEFFAEVVNDHSKGAVVVEDYPMASTVRHLRQNMEEEDGQSYGNERPHGFSVDDIITISEKMGDPSYIVLQKNGRYAEVVSFYNKKNKRVVVAVDFAVTAPGESKNYKYAHELNGYNDGFYNIVVTQYEPDNFAEYLEDCEIIYNKKEMNGRYQVGSGRVVAVTHDTPFIEDIVAEEQPGVNGKLSLFSDSNGRQLTKEQQEYFKDSKVRDENGDLMVMYHGSPEAFTVFDRSKAKSSGYYGRGFYFTNSDSHAKQYGNTYEVYLNITNPIQDGTNDITRDQLRKFVEAVANNEDYGIDNYGYDATVDSVVDRVYGKSDFAMLMDINASCIGNMVEAVELFNEINGTDYNGIIAPTETVAFYPEQIKNVSNKKPTADKDIRYSLSDSAGRQLSRGQQDYFAESQARDDLGQLVSLYHGTENGGFTEFDPQYSDDGISLFMTDNIQMAATYSNSTDPIQLAKGKPKLLRWMDGDPTKGKGQKGVYNVYANLKNPLIVDAKGENWDNLSSEDGYQTVRFQVALSSKHNVNWSNTGIKLTVNTDGQVQTKLFGSMQAMQKFVTENYNQALANNVSLAAYHLEDGGDGFVRAKWNPSTLLEGWQENTREIARKAKAQGYDGVIIRNVLDSGKYGQRTDNEKGTVYIAFDSNQIKIVDNKKPTDDPDIRYSLSQEGQQQRTYGDYRVSGEDVLLEGEQVQAEKTLLEVFMEEQIRRQEEEEKSREAFWKALMQSGEETESVGAAPSGFDPVSHLQYEYGSLPEGEKAVRDDSLPKSTTGKDRVSLTARTVKGAEITPDAFVDLLDQEVVGGKLSYLPVSNNEVTQKAIAYITEEGWEAARGSWSAQVRSGKVSAELTAMGALLLNNAAKAGDRQTWLDVLHDYQIMSTNAGQAVQALRILKTLTPSDNLYMAQKTIRQMVRELKLKKDVQIDEALESAYLAAKTDEAREKAMADIQQHIADQLPATIKDKWTALRYLNMLGNPRTQVRNLVGNTVMGLTTEVKNLIATCLETAGYVASGGRLQRTKSVFVSKGLLKAAFADYSTVKTIVSNGGKYNDQTVGLSDFASGIQDKRRIFKTNFKNDTARKILNDLLAPVEGYRKLTSWSMENGDVPFSKFAYARALSGYLKKHGFNGNDLSKVDAKLMEDARLYAVKEAQEATFHDMNAISKALSKRYHGDNGLLKILNVFAEGVMPFRKTPANIAVRAEEYSPLGVINSLVKSVQAMRSKSDITAADAINSWAKTLTGSGLFLLGMLLAAGGNLTGGPDDDEALDQFGEMYGQQNYSLKLGDWYVTIDWASPASIPLLMGAQWHDQMDENGFQFKDIEKVLTSVLDPLVEMSMMQGFNDALENIQYAENNLIQLVINSSLGYFTQGLTNTFMGQAERSFEDSRTSTYVDKEGDLPDWLQRLLGKNSAKTPGWDYNQIPYINAWGEEQENPDVPINMAYNMLSPSYVSESKEDGVYRELVRLNGAQDENVFPSTPSKEYEDRYLTADEYVALAKTQGQKQKELVYTIVENKTYQAMDDTDKAKVIKFAYKYAKEYAQIEVLGRKSYSAKWLNEIKGDVVAAIIAHVKED